MASRLQQHMARLERRRIIKDEGLRYTSEVRQRFGIGKDTARGDLRAVYGEVPIPDWPRKPRQRKSTTGINPLKQRKLDRIQRHAFIRQEGIRTAAPIMRQFGVVRETALTDLRDVWGEDNIGKRRRVGESPVHVGVWLSLQEHEALVTAAQALDCSVSEAIRIAIQHQYLQNTDLLKAAVSGEVR
jgi:hypothetical protein